jgi:subfamily B ATP-binding cassette protein MsbA
MEARGYPRHRRFSIMKNFARLVRFAWPYRVRFGLSLACASLVAVMWGGNIGAVYPLLSILFRNQNCQYWIAEKVDQTETEVQVATARLAELDEVGRGGTISLAELEPRMRRIFREKQVETESLRKLQEKKITEATRDRNADDGSILPPSEVSLTEAQNRPLRVLDARFDELERALPLIKSHDDRAVETRRAKAERSLADSHWWLDKYVRIQPWVNRYLPKQGFNTLLLLIVVVMAGVALKGFFLFLQEILVADMTQLTLFDIRNEFYRRTLALDLASFNDQGSADLLARFTNDMESLNQGLNTILGRVVREPLRIVTCLGGALWLNWRLTLLALILVPVSAATTYRAGKIMKRAVRRSLESMSNIYKILQESLSGIKVVKAFTTERYERRRFFVETKSFYKKSVRVAVIDALSDPVLEMLALTTVSIALLSGSYLVLNHTTFLNLGFIRLQLASKPMAIEDLLTLYALLAGVSDPIRKLANVHSKIQRAAAASDRICALMDRRPEVHDKQDAARLPRHQFAIEFDSVGFGYNGSKQVLRDIDLKVRHGETIALVGPNGCGKSTLMNLLPRFWDVQSGAIRIDGHDLKDVQLRSLRGQIGMVLQETTLFNDTVANNIAYGNRHMSRQAIIEASKRSYAHQFIMQMPEGYDTMLGEHGVGLSGGQRQRLAIARAMLRDPAILILDEATSAVDIQDEALIRKAIEEFVRGRTTFLITHSLGSLQIADRVVLMNDGRIEAVGTEAELRRSSALFRRLYEIHFQRESA